MIVRRKFARHLFVVLLALIGAATMAGARAADAERIVLQVSDGDVKTWNQALNVADNLQKAYGKGTKIELVAFGMGINMLKMDAPVSSRMADAVKSGIVVYACENSMARFKLARSDMAPDVVYVEAGIQHIITRQREGWVTVRP
jgi:intracellular sulfur oxidation DsrE/DsrF family protein